MRIYLCHLDDEFDGIASIQVLEYIDDVDNAIAEIRRVLKPGGRLCNCIERSLSSTLSKPSSLSNLVRTDPSTSRSAYCDLVQEGEPFHEPQHAQARLRETLLVPS